MALTKIPASLLDTSGGFDLQGNITLGANEEVQFGGASELKIFNDGTNSVLRSSDNLLIQRNTTPRSAITITDSTGEVALAYGGSTVFQTSSAGATVTGTLTVTGDLDITGNINSYNVTDLDVTDQTITLGAGQTEANSGGSGIIVDGSGASILWDETNTEFDINNNINVTGNVKSTAFYVGANTPLNELLYLSGSGHNGHGTTNTRSVASFNQTGQSAGIWIGARNDETTGIIGTRTATGNLAFETYNSGWGERMRITYDGKVGIGTDSPARSLHIRSTGEGSSLFLERSSNYGFVLYNEIETTTETFHLGFVNNGTFSSDILVANESGNVGIGTSIPSQPLHVDATGGGVIRVTRLGNSASAYGQLEHDGTNTSLTSSASLIFNSNATERMRLNASGKLGIGTNNPTHGLTVSDDTVGGDADMRRITIKSATHGVNSGFRFDSESANGTARAGGYYFQPGDTNATTYLGLSANDAANQMVINRDGNVGIGTSSPNISAGSSASTILTVSATAANANGLIELVGTRANSGDVVSYIRTFNNSATTPITDIRSVHKGSDTTGSLEFYTTNAGTSNKALEITQDGFLDIHRNANEYGIAISSAGTRSGLVIQKPGTNTAMGSALVLSDESYRFGTANHYHIQMLQNGYMKELNPGGGVHFNVSKNYTATGSATTNHYIDLSSILGAGTTGYVRVEVSITGYASGGLNGVNSKYSVCGYSGHSFSATNYNSLGAGTIQNGYNSSTSTVYNATGLSYHPAVNMGSNISNGQVWAYSPAAMQYGFTIVNGSSQAIGGYIIITGFYT